MKIDLHLHTTHSDGTLSAMELVKEAAKAELCCMAVTDHDCIADLSEETEFAAQNRIKLIGAAELTSQMGSSEIHILGYRLSYKDERMQQHFNMMKQERQKRVRDICNKLFGLGCRIDAEKLISESAGTVGRCNIARALCKEGCCASVKEAFERYLKEGAPAYISHKLLTAQQIISLISACGGVPVLAHPMRYHLPQELLLQMLSLFKEKGLRGIEVYYPSHTAEDIAFLAHQCRKLGCIATVGTDFHGIGHMEAALGYRSELMTDDEIRNLQDFIL